MKRHLILIVLLFSLILSLPLPLMAQGDSAESVDPVTSTLPADLNTTYIVALVIAIFVVSAPQMLTSIGLMRTVHRLVSDDNIIREAELRYGSANQQTKLLVDSADNTLKTMERLLTQYLPNAMLTEVVDIVEDFTDEVTNGKPYISAQQADRLLYGTTPIGDPPPTDNS